MLEPLSDPPEVLFRQIHPNFLDGGQPSSQAFAPTAKDNNRLSVDRSSVTSAAAAFVLFTDAGHLSAGVYGLTVEEFNGEGISVFPDPIEGSETLKPNPAHAYADYSSFGTNGQKNKAKRLKLKAIARGSLYIPD